MKDREEYISILEQDNAELKKQVEEWKHHLKCSKEMLEIQGQKGNYDYDEYMLGLHNGMEYIIALFETREPNYISGKDVEFTNNRTQQKEFIKYLEDEKDKLAREISNLYEDGLGHTRLVNEDIFDEINDILQKYKEIIEEPKKIEKITVREKTLGFPNGEWTARNMDKAFAIKINELIDEIKNLKEK